MFTYLKGRPITYSFPSVYGFVFALFYLLYGGIKVVLSFMDHNYESLRDPVFFTIIGGILLLMAMGFRDLKNWSWYGLLVINGLAIIDGFFGINQPENIVLIVLSGTAIYCLLTPATKAILIGRS
jgi:hypothetical protein